MWCCKPNPRKYTYKLTYFDVRGLGEPIRMIFHYEGVPFQDVRLTMEDWGTFKAQSRVGMLPELCINNNFTLTQGHAIARLLGNFFGLNGKSELDRARIDEFAGVYKDLNRELNPYLFVLIGRAEGNKKKLRKNVFMPAITRVFPQIVGALAASTAGFLLSSGVSWIDFYFVEYFTSIKNLEPTAFKKYRPLLAYVQRCYQLPSLVDYIKIRPTSEL